MAQKRSKGKSLYRAETYGIKFDSLTFLFFAVFVLLVSVLLVSVVTGIKVF